MRRRDLSASGWRDVDKPIVYAMGDGWEGAVAWVRRTLGARDRLTVRGLTDAHGGLRSSARTSSGRAGGVCVFHFDDDRLITETVYFDHATLLATERRALTTRLPERAFRVVAW